MGEGDAGTSATLEKFKGDYGALSKKELTTGAAGGASEGEVKAETEAKSDLVKGTGVMSVNSTFEGSNSVTLAAKMPRRVQALMLNSDSARRAPSASARRWSPLTA